MSNSLTLRENIDYELLMKIYPMKLTKKSERVRLYNLASSLDEKNNILVKYQKKKYGNLLCGRLFPSVKMNGTFMSRRARATLYGHKEYDIDLVAAHQSIAKYIINREEGEGYFEKNYPILDYYINNREDIIKDFKIPQNVIENHNKLKDRFDTEKDYVKTLITILLYGGKIAEWYNDFDIQKEELPHKIFTDFITPIQKEISLLITLIIHFDKYKNIVENFKKQKEKEKEDYHNGCILSIILQDEETTIVSSCIQYISRTIKDFHTTIYAYDGFQIRHKSGEKNDISDALMEGFITKINDHLTDTFKTDALKFINKPFSSAYTDEEINDIDPIAKYIVPYFIHTNTDELKYIISHFISDKIITCGDEIYFYNGCVWKLEDTAFISKKYRDKIYQLIKREVNFYLDANDKNERKLIPQIINTTSNTLLKHALNEALKECVNNYIKFDEKPHLLNAPNGTYNLDTHILQDHNPTDFITKCISYNIETKNITQKSLEETRKIISCWFNDGYNSPTDVNDLTDFLIQYAGKSLHGHNFIEKAIVLIGKLSRNGKSTFMGLLKHILNDYMCIVPMKHFTNYEKQKNAPSPTIVAMKGCRIFQVDEGGGEKQPIIPETFKKIVGGDYLRARKLYSNKEFVFIPQGIIWFAINYNLTFTTEGYDTIGKLEYFDFNVKYGEKGELGWDEQQINHKKIDNAFKHSLDDTFKKTMLHSLLYQQKQSLKQRPPPFQIWNKEFKTEVDTIGSWIRENIVYDPNDIYFKATDYCVQNYNKVYNAYNLADTQGKKIIRKITLDFIYKRYNNDCGCDAVSKKNFMHSLKIAFKDLIPKGKTRLFGGKKYYIEKAKYIGRDFGDDED